MGGGHDRQCPLSGLIVSVFLYIQVNHRRRKKATCSGEPRAHAGWNPQSCPIFPNSEAKK